MKRHLAFAAAGIVVALGVATAQAQSFDISRLKPGTSFRWQVGNGITTETYLGPVNGVYAFEFTRDASRGQPLKMVWWATRNNQLTTISGSGITEWYQPNDCSLTVGECHYRRIRAGGGSQNMTRITTVNGDTWSYQLYRQGLFGRVLEQSGSFTVDANGFVINETDLYPNGQTGFVRRLP
jgi:hypothetical protein